MRPKTIRAKIALMTGAVSMLVVLGFGLFLYASLRNQLLNSVDENLRLRGLQLLDAIETQNGQVRFDRNAVSAIEVVREEGASLVSVSGDLLDRIGQEPLPVLTALNNQRVQYQTLRFSEIEESDERDLEIYRFLIFPIEYEGELLAYLQVGQDIEEVQEALTGLVRLLLLTGPFLIGLSVIGGYSLAGRALAPMEKIRQQVASIQARDLPMRINPPMAEDEVGRLARTFNTLLERLEKSFIRQLRFTADASHELRTPLAVIQGTIEVGLECPRSQAEYIEILQSIIPEVQRMSRLVNELLMLARADADEIHLKLEQIDLADLLRMAVDTMQPQAEDAGVRFHIELPSPLPLQGDRDRLLELFFNLIENAILYAPASLVTIGGELAGEVVRVWITDTGPGIPEEHLPHVFDRFYQADPSRGRRERGSGLGLAISQEIARMHGGRVSVQSLQGKGTTFIVELRIQPP